MKKLNYIAGTILLLVFLYSSIALEDIAEGIVSATCILLGILLFIANMIGEAVKNSKNIGPFRIVIFFSILLALYLYFIF